MSPVKKKSRRKGDDIILPPLEESVTMEDVGRALVGKTEPVKLVTNQKKDSTFPKNLANKGEEND